VKFSPSGLFLATGCNRSTQLYNTVTGSLITTLLDPTAPTEGDLYIRSVVFCGVNDSNHGIITLATGAEDRCIRVWEIDLYGGGSSGGGGGNTSGGGGSSSGNGGNNSGGVSGNNGTGMASSLSGTVKTKLKWTLIGHEQDIYSLDWSAAHGSGGVILSGSGDRCVKVTKK